MICMVIPDILNVRALSCYGIQTTETTACVSHLVRLHSGIDSSVSHMLEFVSAYKSKYILNHGLWLIFLVVALQHLE